MIASHKYSAESKRRLDRVFHYFLFFGATALVLSMATLIPAAAAAADRAGFWLIAIAGLALLSALAAAARYSVRVWRRRSVRVLWLATLIVPILLLFQVGWLSRTAGWLYALVAIGVPLWWFLHERKAAVH